MEKFKFIDGEWLVHDAENCFSYYCAIHNPSKHNMVKWPLYLRETGLMERMCKHGVGHPDPDSAAYIAQIHNHTVNTWLSHGCDGCCIVEFIGCEA
jgi:hypothetical protein